MICTTGVSWRSASTTCMPLDSVARWTAGNFRSGKVVVFGTPALRSTSVFTVLNFGSTFGVAAGVVAGAANTVSGRAEAGVSLGCTRMVCDAPASHFFAAACTSAAVALARMSSSSW